LTLDNAQALTRVIVQDANAASQIKKITSNTLAYGIDCITKEGSTELCQQCFPTAEESSRGQLVLMLWPAPPSVNDNVDTKIAIDVGENNLPKYSDYYSEEDQKIIRRQCRDLTSYLESGQFKPLPVTDVPELDKVQEVMHSVRSELPYLTLLVVLKRLRANMATRITSWYPPFQDGPNDYLI
jgi:hypothetical protein